MGLTSCVCSSTTQALASVRTYTWRKRQRRCDDAPEDFPRGRQHKAAAYREWNCRLWVINLWLLYAHCDVLSSYATNNTFPVTFLCSFSSPQNSAWYCYCCGSIYFSFCKVFKVIFIIYMVLWVFMTCLNVGQHWSIYMCVYIYMRRIDWALLLA